MPEPWANGIDRLHPESLPTPPQRVRRHGTVARNRGAAVVSGRSRPAAGNDPFQPFVSATAPRPVSEWTGRSDLTLEWVDWFNNRRLLEPIGNVPPAEFEMQYLLQQTKSAIPA